MHRLRPYSEEIIAKNRFQSENRERGGGQTYLSYVLEKAKKKDEGGKRTARTELESERSDRPAQKEEDW